MRGISTAAVALFALAAPASAAPFVFEFSGSLRAGDQLTAAGSGSNLIGSDRSFRLTASFDTSSPNLVGFFPFPGFVAYAPTSATIRIGSTTYGIATYDAATPEGIAIALFDPRQPFFPGLYGAGFIADPAADGAGIVGDFSSASPQFLVDSLVNTTFTGFNGTGYNQGPGCAAVDPAPCVPTPLSLSANGQAYSLLLGPSEEIVGGPLATASLTAVSVPEPSSWAMLTLGLAACTAMRRRAARFGR